MGTEGGTRRVAEAPPEATGVRTGTAPTVAEQLAGTPNEPFLRVERLLVASSLLLGLALLGVLAWVSETFFAG